MLSGAEAEVIQRVAKPLSEEELARASIYSMLGALLSRPPQPAMLDRLVAIRGDDDSQPGAALGVAWQRLQQAATDAGDLEDEFHQLFIGLGRGELVPYASWYRTGFLNEKPLADLRADLARLGMERRPDVAEPEDHAAALCETMALIISSGDSFGFAVQQQFFATHMEPWMGKFFADLSGAKTARFYRAVGEFGRAFVSIEKEYFAMPV